MAVNDTVTQTASSGYLTVYPTGSAVPGSSDLNWLQGQTVANFTLAGTGSSGEVSFYNGSVGSTQLIVDVFGFFANS